MKVVVGMSGGVDSTLTAARLKDAGYEVVGVTLHLWDNEKTQKAIADARKQASTLGIEHHVVDYREPFRTKIVDTFIGDYLNGLTPSPCTICNPEIKWHALANFADSIGAQYISSGHYIEVQEHNGHYYVAKGVDAKKDQSYYLWMLPETIISRMIQPLGGITKEQTRQEIRQKQLEDIVPSGESMSVCFLAGMNYRDFLEQQAPEAMAAIQQGRVIKADGTPIGFHKGLPYYTVGQKRDLMLDAPQEAYVMDMDAASNTITVGKKADLMRYEFYIGKMHFICQDEITPATPVEVKVRGLGLNPEGAGFIKFEGDTAHITLTSPAWAMAKGQPVVFYIGHRLLGGGVVI